MRDFLDSDFYLSPESHVGAVLDEIEAAYAEDSLGSMDDTEAVEEDT
jgi:hypothetical protein